MISARSEPSADPRERHDVAGDEFLRIAQVSVERGLVPDNLRALHRTAVAEPGNAAGSAPDELLQRGSGTVAAVDGVTHGALAECGARRRRILRDA